MRYIHIKFNSLISDTRVPEQNSIDLVTINLYGDKMQKVMAYRSKQSGKLLAILFRL